MSQKLFSLMLQEHGVTLLETEINDIEQCVRETDHDLIDKYCKSQEQLGLAKDILGRIIAAHKQSSVDWEATRQAEKLIGEGENEPV